MIADLGAYQQLLTPFIPELGFPVAGGCYRFPVIDLHFTGVFTNKMPTDAIRGAGRPEITYWIELMMDKLADELGMDPLELRRKNFIPKDEFPYETALGIVYDSGDYHGSLDKLLEHFDLDAFRREQAELRDKGVHRGVGFSTWVEVCGLAPSRAVGPQGVGLQGAFWESAMVRVHAHRLGDRLHGHLAARPGPRHRLRADRGRPAGHRPAERGRDPRRHRPGPVGLGHLRLALARGGRRGDRAGGAEGAGEGQAHLRGAARRRRRRTSSWPTASTR